MILVSSTHCNEVLKIARPCGGRFHSSSNWRLPTNAGITLFRNQDNRIENRLALLNRQLATGNHENNRHERAAFLPWHDLAAGPATALPDGRRCRFGENPSHAQARAAKAGDNGPVDTLRAVLQRLSIVGSNGAYAHPEMISRFLCGLALERHHAQHGARALG